MSASETESLACSQRLEERLSPLLGPFTARVAVRTFAQKKLGRAPQELSPQEIPTLLEAMRPMLNTLLGAPRARQELEQLQREFALR